MHTQMRHRTHSPNCREVIKLPDPMETDLARSLIKAVINTIIVHSFTFCENQNKIDNFQLPLGNVNKSFKNLSIVGQVQEFKKNIFAL